MKKPIVIAALSCVLVTAACSAESTDSDPKAPLDDGSATVDLDSGRIRGTVTDEYRSFEGVPYAAPPVGDLRWAPPEAVEPWEGTRDAVEPGNLCPQEATQYADSASLNEDCLYLNVTVPRGVESDRPRPVMVWIHGDGVVGGGEFFDGRPLATTGDVIVVTVNYRLGLFGAFGHPDLPDGGTFGLQDQQAALRWVQRNAEAFGGDPDNVTVFGESYGALSVSAHLTSPAAEGLFDRAIVQSGMALSDLPAGALNPGLEALDWHGWRSAEETAAVGASVAGELGCADPSTALACLRAKPVAELFEYPQIMRIFQPWTFGNETLPVVPAQAIRDGDSHEVPVISGSTKDEHRIFVGFFFDLLGTPVTAEQYPQLLATTFGDDAAAVEAEYPLTGFESPSIAWATVMTDRMWATFTFEQNQLFSDRAETYAYEFADTEAPMYVPFPDTLPPGAYHAADVPYLFPGEEFADATPEQRELSTTMMTYWANFATDGDPNGTDLPEWTAFDTADRVPYVQSLGPGSGAIGAVDYAAAHRLEFWDHLR
ncbi:MAG TPA: carboxylesterase family protein [Jiangellaceae bacterium]